MINCRALDWIGRIRSMQYCSCSVVVRSKKGNNNTLEVSERKIEPLQRSFWKNETTGTQSKCQGTLLEDIWYLLINFSCATKGPGLGMTSPSKAIWWSCLARATLLSKSYHGLTYLVLSILIANISCKTRAIFHANLYDRFWRNLNKKNNGISMVLLLHFRSI